MFYADARVFKETPDKKKCYGPILAIDNSLPWFWISGPKFTEKQFGIPGGQLLIADIHSLKNAVEMFPIDFVRINLPSLSKSRGPVENRIKRVLRGTYQHGKVLSEVFKFVLQDNEIAYYDQQNSCSNYEQLEYTDFLELH